MTKVSHTLLYIPDPSGSARTTFTSTLTFFRNCPIPAIVPPVPPGSMSANYDSDQVVHTSSRNESINSSISLSPNFGARAIEMGRKVTQILKQ